MSSFPVRVYIVEDSPVIQRLLRYCIDSDPRLTVVGMAGDAERALADIPRLRPDVVSMDVRLPGLDGFEATRRIMREHPLPIVIVASDVEGPALKISFNALRAGALTVVEKPGGTGRADYEALARHLCTQLYIMSRVPVIRQRLPLPAEEHRSPAPPASRCDLVGVVASTGGPHALVRLFNSLPADFPLPIALVQHIGASFTAGFAAWLGSVVPLPVSLAADGESPKRGHIHVAPGNVHLTLRKGLFRLLAGELVCGQRPSGDVLFETMAAELGGRALGVLLTGMGEDGARGLLAIRRAGGYTIAEDESTAVIYGMPAAAVRLQAVIDLLPLDAIGQRLVSMSQRGAA